jgi:hypothetical protein
MTGLAIIFLAAVCFSDLPRSFLYNTLNGVSSWVIAILSAFAFALAANL